MRKSIFVIFYWITLATKLIPLSLVVFSEDLRDSNNNKLILVATAMGIISAILLTVAIVINMKQKFKDKVPQNVTVIVLAIAGSSTLVETILFGTEAFKDEYNGLLTAIFTYSLICLLSIVSLIILIFIKSPTLQIVPTVPVSEGTPKPPSDDLIHQENKPNSPKRNSPDF